MCVACTQLSEDHFQELIQSKRFNYRDQTLAWKVLLCAEPRKKKKPLIIALDMNNARACARTHARTLSMPTGIAILPL